jgi:hypothetical protein
MLKAPIEIDDRHGGGVLKDRNKAWSSWMSGVSDGALGGKN